MTGQTIIYFSSMLVTCILTGYLAWYAWKHRQVPGSSAYARLALSECLLALSESFSVLSPSLGWALFWFQLRYIIGAFIAVSWFVFALEYSGHREWISKRLLVGLFIIPFVTQILQWSNRLHGLWMKQEAGFYQNGPFWIADITTRLPGLGYLTHSFYTLFLTLAGIVLMLMSAWKLRRELVAQALLLAGAGLTAFVFVINALFNLLPKMEFNIFTPGIGLSVLLIALAVFRFEFLKRAPVQKGVLQVNRPDAREKYSLAFYILMFILFTSGIAAVSNLAYHNYEEQFRAQVEGQLAAIAELKVNGIMNWRAERTGDAEALQKNPTFAALVQKSMENPDDIQAKAQLQIWLDTVRSSFGYDRVFILDTRGVELVSSPAAPKPVAAHLMQEAAAILKMGQVTFLDFYRDASDDTIRLALLAPIYAEQDLSRPLGLLVLRIDPKVYLYPYIIQWPTVSATAETLLVRRDGNDALFLNELKFQQDTALNLRIPLEETQVLAVQAVLGKTGIVQGVDYRNVEVIGYVHALPDSPWFLVARMDTAEVYAPLRERLWQTILLFGALVLVAGAGLMLVWRQQRIRFYRGQVEAAEALRESEEKFKYIFDNSSVGKSLTLPAGEIQVNRAFCDMLGYSEDELKSGRWQNITHPDDMELSQRMVNSLLSSDKESVRFTKRYIHKTGSVVWADVSTSLRRDKDDKPLYFITAVSDITERKRAEEETLRLWNILDKSQNEIYIFDPQTLQFQYVNSGARQNLGYSVEQLHVLTPVDIKPEFTEDSFKAVLTPLLLKEKENIVFQTVHRRADGSLYPVEVHLQLVEHGGSLQFLAVINDITARKQIEDALQKNQMQLEAIMDYSPALISIKDLDGTVILANQGFAVLDAPPLNELIGKNVFDIFPKEVAEQLWNNDLAALQAEAPIRSEEVVKHKDGTWHTYWTVKFPIYLQSDQLFGVCAISNDITERKQMEEALRASEARLRAILDATPFPVALVDVKDNNIEFWSHSALTLFGHIASTTAEWYQIAYPDPDYRREVIERWKPALEKARLTAQEVNTGEYRITCRDGSVRICELYAEFLGESLIVTFNDITERKQAEEKLIASEVRYRSLFESARDGILILDAETGVITDVNPFLVKMLGFSHEVFLGKKLWELGFFKDIAASKENFLELQQQEYIRYEDLPLETADGRRVQVEFTSNVYHTDQHKVIQCNIRDITERKKAREKLLQTLDELKRSNSELEQFAYIASHDLQEPLRAVAGMVQLLQKRYQGQLDGRADEYIALAMDGATRMQTLITDLLTYSRVERRGNPMQTTDANAALQIALRNLEVSITEQGATVTSDNLPILEADAAQLTQLFQNLIGNAIKFHGAHPTLIHIGVEKLDDAWRFNVCDNGIGIEPQYFERIFLIFQRLHTRRDYPGTGIGLSICKKIVERHGGSIWVDSQPGQSTTFHFTIPYRR